MFEVACESCRRVLDVPDQHQGKKAKCPQCGAVMLLVPAAAFAPEPPPPPPEASFTGIDPFAHRQAETAKAKKRRASSWRGLVLIAGIVLGVLLGATATVGGLSNSKLFLPTIGCALLGLMIGIVALAIPIIVLASIAVRDKRNRTVIMPEVENIGCGALFGVVAGSLLGASYGAQHGSGHSSWSWMFISPAFLGAFVGGLISGGFTYGCLFALSPSQDEQPTQPEE